MHHHADESGPREGLPRITDLVADPLHRDLPPIGERASRSASDDHAEGIDAVVASSPRSRRERQREAERFAGAAGTCW